MLLIGIILICLAIPLCSSQSLVYTRCTVLILAGGLLLALQGTIINEEVSFYSGLLYSNQLTIYLDVFLLLLVSMIILVWSSSIFKNIISNSVNMISESNLIIIFSTLGASMLISSSDLISIYLSLELQSFALYILAGIKKDSESDIGASLKYFLLGAFSSALILLGCALIYTITGTTQFESLISIIIVGESDISYKEGSFTNMLLGPLMLIITGFFFKVSAAPFHNWAPDVYNGVNTLTTIVLTTLPKISLFGFILTLVYTLTPSVELTLFSILNIRMQDYSILNITFSTYLFLVSILSLIIGTVVGLAQTQIKRLLAYSTISHVGFIVLALSITNVEALSSIIFYLVQYSVTTLTAFMILLAFSNYFKLHKDVQFIKELQGVVWVIPVLTISLVLALFSIAGIPPLVGFYAKYEVLEATINQGLYSGAIIAICTSVVSAAYYLKLIKVISFENTELNYNQSNDNNIENISFISSSHSYLIALSTMFIVLYIFEPHLLLNCTELVALSLSVS